MALIPLHDKPAPPTGLWPTLASFGFRLFFLLAALMALLMVPVWLIALNGWQNGLALQHYGSYWHAHEMLLGYTSAVVAGFLLTAAKNWTGQQTVVGAPLLALGVCWLAGRSLIWFNSPWLHWLGLLSDLLFLPALAWFVARPILAIKQRRNYLFPLLLTVLTAIHVVMHLAFFEQDVVLAQQCLHLTLFAMLTLIVIMACRVVPFFTERGLNMTTALRRNEQHDLACAVAVAVAGLSHVFIGGWFSAIWLMLAALVLGWRISQWYQPGIWRVPLLWVLHVGMGWLVLGLVLLAWQNLHLPTLPPVGTSPLHALTTGCIGLMTLGMMARVSLGHSGRPLQTVAATHWAFILLSIAALVRVFGVWLFSSHYLLLVTVAGCLWTAAFALFLWIYVPILTTPSK